MHFQSPLMHVAWKKVCRTEHAKREERQADRQTETETEEMYVLGVRRS